MTSLLVWIPILPWTQPQQRLRSAVERDLRDGHIDRALAIMSSHQRNDFPPHWDPPPRIGYGEEHPPIVEVLEACLTNDPKPWVTELFLRKFEHAGYANGTQPYGDRMDSDRFDRLLDMLERLPDDS